MTQTDGSLSELQQWYTSNCDGDWEHQYGIEIGTLDNPGWRLEVDLTETVLATCSFPGVEVTNNPTDWYRCGVESRVFKGLGGPENLPDMIRVFVEWWHANTASASSDD
jgi:hypothetical protein